MALLAARFLAEAAKRHHLRLSPEALAWLAGWEWAGNVRALRAAVAARVALADGAAVTAEDLAVARSGDPAAIALVAPANLAEAVADLERRMITAALAATGNSHSVAPRQFGLSRVGLLKMMRQLGLR